MFRSKLTTCLRLNQGQASLSLTKLSQTKLYKLASRYGALEKGCSWPTEATKKGQSHTKALFISSWYLTNTLNQTYSAPRSSTPFFGSVFNALTDDVPQFVSCVNCWPLDQSWLKWVNREVVQMSWLVSIFLHQSRGRETSLWRIVHKRHK